MSLIVEINRLIDEEITEMLWILSIRCAISYEEMAEAVGRTELMQRPMPETERIAKAKEKRLQLENDNENLREQIVIVETRIRQKPRQVVEEPPQIVELVVEQVVEDQPVKAKRQYKKKEVTEKKEEEEVKEVKEKKVKEKKVKEKEVVEKPEKPAEKSERVVIDRTVTLSRLPNKSMLRLSRKSKTDKTVTNILTLVFRHETQTFFDQETHVEYKTLAEANRLWCRTNDLTPSGNVWVDFKAYCQLTEECRSINTLHETDWFADLAEPARNGFIDREYIFPGEVVFERPMTPVLEVEEEKEEKEPQKAARGRPKKDVATYSFEEPELGPEVVAEETAYRTSEDEEDDDDEDDVVTRNVEKFCVDGVEYFKCTESDMLYKTDESGQPVEIGMWCARTKRIYTNRLDDVSDDDEE